MLFLDYILCGVNKSIVQLCVYVSVEELEGKMDTAFD